MGQHLPHGGAEADVVGCGVAWGFGDWVCEGGRPQGRAPPCCWAVWGGGAALFGERGLGGARGDGDGRVPRVGDGRCVQQVVVRGQGEGWGAVALWDRG